VRLLLDTQIFLWFVADSPRLAKSARAEIRAADEVNVSAASIWEAAIKVSSGKLTVSLDDLEASIETSGFDELPVRATHARRVAALPAHHRDPFDRLLIAQALEEPMVFLTADRGLARYSDLIRVI
jgi:PIN domain nuclease of toxin-antitoxin system